MQEQERQEKLELEKQKLEIQEQERKENLALKQQELDA